MDEWRVKNLKAKKKELRLIDNEIGKGWLSCQTNCNSYNEHIDVYKAYIAQHRLYSRMLKLINET